MDPKDMMPVEISDQTMWTLSTESQDPPPRPTAGGPSASHGEWTAPRAYKLAQIVLTAAMQQQQLIERQMAAFLASAPTSRAAWLTGDLAAKGIPLAELSPVSVPGLFSVCGGRGY
jgi:hypothetical protein